MLTTTVKTKEDFRDPKLNPMVKAITLYANEYCLEHFGIGLFLTSIYRPGDGIHGDHRAIDSDNDALSDDKMREVEAHINEKFVYDPQRPRYKVCIYHTVKGRGGDHLHMQTHRNTRLRIAPQGG